MTRTARALMLGTALMTLAAPAVASAQSQPGGSSPMQVHAMAQQPALNLSAYGEVKVAPDQAAINFGVVTEAPTAQEAMAQNAQQMTRVVAALRRAGIAERDIQTSGLNLSPMLDYSKDGEAPRVTGYAAQNNVTVRVRDIAGLGTVLDKLIASGANEVSGITFSREDMTATEDEARMKAVADARRRAETMAEAAGMKLGPLMALSDVPMDSGPMPMPRMAMAAEAKMGGAPIEAGELAVTTNVTAVYALRPADAPDAPEGMDMPEGEAEAAPAN